MKTTVPTKLCLHNEHRPCYHACPGFARLQRRYKLALGEICFLKVGQLCRSPRAFRGVHKREAANYGGELLKCKNGVGNVISANTECL